MLEHGELKMQLELGPVSFLKDDREVKQGIRRNFARRARSYDRHAEMQRRMAHGLVAAVGESLARAGRILEIGCGTGYLTGLLRQANGEARLVALDLDAALVDAARRRLGPEAGVAWLVADGETPLRGEYDLIIANATFQWFTRPGETLAALYRNLAPGGVLAFSTLGPRTFQELAESLNQAGRSLNLPAIPPIPAQGFGDRETWSDRLYGAGFPQVRLGREMATATFPSVKEFLQALQATGATNPRPGQFSPRLLHALMAAYQTNYGRDGAIPVSYEMIWAVAEKS
ncbi:MAG: methyltransferase domain-containing protein [Proteobacteria bacterium]|nr:methyltransferase domain-containing protein [Pseudomonadota bacterium]MBU4353914.1 methyltransferase domain-containing protein [Pseudomonadota bacterium]MBU4447093.1 methyltransferase domain-containing protein [Pseudomonadota bacterium]MCG2771760.1 methyltransferase domain-containing protein [Desulfobacterales bacterium]